MTPRRILAARGGALGDFILTLPSLAALRSRWPDAEIQLLASPSHAALARSAGLSHDHRDPASAAASFLFHPETPAPPTLATWIGSCDLAVSWLPDPEGITRQRLRQCGIPEVHQGPWTMNPDRPAWLQLADALPGHLPVHPIQLAAPSRSGSLAIHPGSGGPRKIWPADRWLATLRHLHQQDLISSCLLVTGECEEHTPASQLAPALQLSGIPTRTAHQLALPELVATLASCQWFAGHDSGIAHLAAACGLPTHILFGPTSPSVWAPPGSRILTSPDHAIDSLATTTVSQWLADHLAQ
jgi:heptosyltransferase-3